jgi:hypothetical protein
MTFIGGWTSSNAPIVALESVLRSACVALGLVIVGADAPSLAIPRSGPVDLCRWVFAE